MEMKMKDYSEIAFLPKSVSGYAKSDNSIRGVSWLDVLNSSGPRGIKTTLALPEGSGSHKWN
jgi:hypothetical protein